MAFRRIGKSVHACNAAQVCAQPKQYLLYHFAIRHAMSSPYNIITLFSLYRFNQTLRRCSRKTGTAGARTPAFRGCERHFGLLVRHTSHYKCPSNERLDERRPRDDRLLQRRHMARRLQDRARRHPRDGRGARDSGGRTSRTPRRTPTQADPPITPANGRQTHSRRILAIALQGAKKRALESALAHQDVPLQPHVRRCRVLLAEQLDGRGRAVPV